MAEPDPWMLLAEVDACAVMRSIGAKISSRKNSQYVMRFTSILLEKIPKLSENLGKRKADAELEPGESRKVQALSAPSDVYAVRIHEADSRIRQEAAEIPEAHCPDLTVRDVDVCVSPQAETECLVEMNGIQPGVSEAAMEKAPSSNAGERPDFSAEQQSYSAQTDRKSSKEKLLTQYTRRRIRFGI